jgi:uncharacterized membrane protein
MIRRGYLDWMRGVATLLMVAGHTYDAWTRPSDRDGLPYRTVIFLGGFAAPAFLFLAGVALALGARARMAKGRDLADVAALARRRGWQVFGLAFLFRLQSYLVSGGRFPDALFKVDILNILGLSMVLAGALWARGASRRNRVTWMLGVAGVLAALAPFVRGVDGIQTWPDWMAMYARSVPGRTSFSLVPWPAYLLVGAAVGDWLVDLSAATDERRATARLAWTGLVAVIVGLAAAASPWFGGWHASWTTAPPFLAMRAGVLLLAVFACHRLFERFGLSGWCSCIRELGVSSLFVYWVHVELAYGRPARVFARTLGFAEATWAYLALCLLLYGLVRAKGTVGRLTKVGGKSGKFNANSPVSA